MSEWAKQHIVPILIGIFIAFVGGVLVLAVGPSIQTTASSDSDIDAKEKIKAQTGLLLYVVSDGHSDKTDIIPSKNGNDYDTIIESQTFNYTLSVYNLSTDIQGLEIFLPLNGQAPKDLYLSVTTSKVAIQKLAGSGEDVMRVGGIRIYIDEFPEASDFVLNIKSNEKIAYTFLSPISNLSKVELVEPRFLHYQFKKD